MRSASPSRGEIWLTRLDPVEGHEIRKTRPCLVVTPDSMNRFLGTVVVMPMTGGSRPARFRLPTVFNDKPGFLLGDQIRSVSLGRLLKLIGHAEPEEIAAALRILREMFED